MTQGREREREINKIINGYELADAEYEWFLSAEYEALIMEVTKIQKARKKMEREGRGRGLLSRNTSFHSLRGGETSKSRKIGEITRNSNRTSGGDMGKVRMGGR